MVLSLLVVGIFTWTVLNIFSPSQIIILEHMTEEFNGVVDQICLVQNPPRKSERLYSMIEEFNRDCPTVNGLYHRLFIKEHDFELGIFPFPHNVDYADSSATRDDLDNIDFLGRSDLNLSVHGDTIRKTLVFVGVHDYYKE